MKNRFTHLSAVCLKDLDPIYRRLARFAVFARNLRNPIRFGSVIRTQMGSPSKVIPFEFDPKDEGEVAVFSTKR